MKIEKNKIVFASVLIIIFGFLIAYWFWIYGEDGDSATTFNQPTVPELEEGTKEYNSKLDALNDLKEERQTNAPSLYNERLLDSTGVYDPLLEEKHKQHIVDSIYAAARITYSPTPKNQQGVKSVTKPSLQAIDKPPIKKESSDSKAVALAHQLFFASKPEILERNEAADTDILLYATVDGDQTVKAHYRLRMRLTQAAQIHGVLIPKNTPIYGFIGFQPNRALIEIKNLYHIPIELAAYDRQDGLEGIYIENSFRAEATQEVLDDVIGDINIPSVPQVGGITKVLRRKNRNVKVTVLNNYQLILKLKL